MSDNESPYQEPTPEVSKPLFQDEVDQDPPTQVLEPIDPTETVDSAPRLSLLIAIGAGAALGISKLGSSNDNPEAAAAPSTPKPVATAPLTPGTTQTPKAETTTEPTPTHTPSAAEPTEASTPDLEIQLLSGVITPLSIDEYPDGVDVAKAYISRYNTWINSGMTEDQLYSDARDSLSDDEYVDQVAKPVDTANIKALFPSDWQNNPRLKDYVDSIVSIHHDTLRVFQATANSSNEEPYERSLVINDYPEVTDSSNKLTITISFNGEDNRDMNDAEDYQEVDANDINGFITLTFVQHDGNWVIEDITT